MKGYRLIIVACLLFGLTARAQNNPYVDDKVVHFGFSLGINLMSLRVNNSDIPVVLPYDGMPPKVLHASVSNLLPGFSVGFITDVRLCRHLNLRFCPALSFAQRTITYECEDKTPIHSADGKLTNQVSLLSIPITVPLYLKWSAEREKNYRPYLIGGGGFEYNVYRDAEMPIMLKGPDAFVEVGFGCDFYFRWFKFCPQLTYRIGFLNLNTPHEEHPQLLEGNYFYADAISQLKSHQLCLTFNFE